MNYSIQKKLFTLIKEDLKNDSFVNELADVLNVSIDSAYRRIRCETALTIDEVSKLCKHYEISFDALNDFSSNTVFFSYNSFEQDEKSFFKYFEVLFDRLQKVRKNENGQIIYIADDIPLFYHFNYPALYSFKLFYWMKSVLNIPSLQDKKYEAEYITEKFSKYSKALFENYIDIPTIEIWNDNSISSIIKQIEFYFESGWFHGRDNAVLICNELKQELIDIRQMAVLGTKNVTKIDSVEEKKNFELYFSDVEIGNNYIYVKSDETKAVFLRHHTFHSMYTYDPSFCKDTENWLQNIISKSTLISGSAEKQRNQFFNRAIERVESLEKSL